MEEERDRNQKRRTAEKKEKQKRKKTVRGKKRSWTSLKKREKK